MRPDPESRPPAGGFGQSPHSASFGPQIGPRRDRRSIIGLVSVGVLVLCGFGALGVRSLRMMGAKEDQRRVKEQVAFVASLGLKAYEDDGALCPSAAPVPGHIELVRGQLYQSSNHDWSDDPGWRCLGYLPESSLPQRYQYRYDQTADGFVVTAEGDVDADGVNSRFRLAAHFHKSKGSPRDVLAVDPTIEETNPGE